MISFFKVNRVVYRKNVSCDKSFPLVIGWRIIILHKVCIVLLIQSNEFQNLQSAKEELEAELKHNLQLMEKNLKEKSDTLEKVCFSKY